MELTISERAKSFIAVIAEDGGSIAYDQWASSYEVDVNSMNYSGYSSVVQKWQSFHINVGKKHKILDTGCGTGLAGELLLNSISTPQAIQLYGGDISTEMLKIAKSKGIYTELQVINLKEELPYEANSFDSVICAGVFGVGHCGSECLPNILRVLKPGCFFIATVNEKVFDLTTAEEWKKQIATCNCELLENTKIPYLDYATAFVLVVRKLIQN